MEISQRTGCPVATVPMFRVHMPVYRNHPLIEDLKRKEFVPPVALTEEQACGSTFMKEFTAACRTMTPLVEFTTKALGF